MNFMAKKENETRKTSLTTKLIDLRKLDRKQCDGIRFLISESVGKSCANIESGALFCFPCSMTLCSTSIETKSTRKTRKTNNFHSEREMIFLLYFLAVSTSKRKRRRNFPTIETIFAFRFSTKNIFFSVSPIKDVAKRRSMFSFVFPRSEVFPNRRADENRENFSGRKIGSTRIFDRLFFHCESKRKIVDDVILQRTEFFLISAKKKSKNSENDFSFHSLKLFFLSAFETFDGD